MEPDNTPNPNPSSPPTTQTPDPAATNPTSPSSTPTPASNPSSNAPAPTDPPAAPAPAPGTPAEPPATPATPPEPAKVDPPAELEYDVEVDETSPLTDAELNAIAEYAAKNGLTKDEAQRLVSLQEEQYNRGKTEAQTYHQQILDQRRQELNSHPEFSGEKAQQSWNSVNKALEVFGSEKLKQVLGSTEHGYDVEIALLLKNIGDQLQPEVLPGKGTGAPVMTPSEEDAKLRRLYPSFYQDKK